MDGIQTQRLELRPLEESHAALVLPIWSDEAVVKNTYVRDIHNEDDCKKRIVRMVQASKERNDIGPYAIFQGEDFIGIVAASRDAVHEYGLYYHLGRQYWGKGYATEAAKAVLDAAFQHPEIVRVFAEVLTTNPASERVLIKLGMRHEGCLRRKFYRKGVLGDLNVYSILRKEYSAPR
ncbi:GNAT family N-acetyltransferase [Eubacteriales bacterium OttesenSCG-928-M02]|nr:GNAT family N-acetyltransferase [Eubacteriales bacterium OttesenSCG-928-M02]